MLRDESKPITDADVWRYIKTEKIGAPCEKGICACGRMIVYRFNYLETVWGNHSRRRCVDRRNKRVITGAKWS